MMNKEALREKLAQLPPAKALALAEAETAFWDVNHIHKLTSLEGAVRFLLSWPLAIEAVALLKQMEPLCARLLVSALRGYSGTPEDMLKASEILRLCEELSLLAWDD